MPVMCEIGPIDLQEMHGTTPVQGGTMSFERLDLEKTEVMAGLYTAKRYSERDVQLIRAGDTQAPLLKILSGWTFRYSLLANGRRQILSVGLPGDLIGLDTLLTRIPSYPVQCAGTVLYYLIDRERAQALAAEKEWFRRQALQALIEDRATAQLSLARLGQCNAEERVASVLLDLYRRLEARGLAIAGSFTLELTQTHLADIVGLTSVHLNRVLQRLKGRGLLAMRGHRVTLPDIQALECLAMAGP